MTAAISCSDRRRWAGRHRTEAMAPGGEAHRAHVRVEVHQRHPHRHRPGVGEGPVELVLVPRRPPPAGLLEQRLVVVEAHLVHAQEGGGHPGEAGGQHEPGDGVVDAPQVGGLQEGPPVGAPLGQGAAARALWAAAAAATMGRAERRDLLGRGQGRSRPRDRHARSGDGLGADVVAVVEAEGALRTGFAAAGRRRCAGPPRDSASISGRSNSSPSLALGPVLGQGLDQRRHGHPVARPPPRARPRARPA